MKTTFLEFISGGHIFLILIVLIAIVYGIYKGLYKIFGKESIESKLKTAKKMHDKKLITTEQYEAMKERIIKESEI